VAYVYVPNTASDGFRSFNRYFYSQVGKEAVIVDERFNEGGQLADYIVQSLNRQLLSRVVTRDGRDWVSPSQAIYGPKVMIINEMSGSGGDALPWYFRKSGIGPLVGKRTWGGLIGIGGYPELIDGGSASRDLWAERRVGGRESRRGSGCRGRIRPAGFSRGPRHSARQGDRGGQAASKGASGATDFATRVPRLSPAR
jgi:tricorn protease